VWPTPAFHYRLGREFSPLRAEGVADVASLYGSYPLIRSHKAILYVLGNLEAKRFEDKIRLTSSSARKRSVALRLGLAGDARDNWGGGGWTEYGLGLTHGDLELRDPAAAAADRLSGRTDGGYDKVSTSASPDC
jgi:hemolysin activation/secretion protein